MRTVALPATIFVALWAACSQATPMPPTNYVLAPLYTPSNPSAASDVSATTAHIISDSYLIVLQDHLQDHEVAQHHAHVEQLHAADSRLRHFKRIEEHRAQFGGDGDNLFMTQVMDELHGIKHRFDIGKKANKKARKAMRGYSGKFSQSTLDAIRAMKGVKYVERDSIVQAYEVERGAPWGLARISHRKPLSFGTFNLYEYDGHGGEGVDAYVIDTGVNIDHDEFKGRAKWGTTIPQDADKDLNGHGTHVAGTMASAKYGVAKRANIIAVKVLGAGGSGTMSDVVAGVAWAADAAYAKAKKNDSKHKGSVANMSLGGGKSQALDDAVDSAVEDGLHFAVAAGNDDRDACAYSPAGAVNAITVGASTIADERAYFSNHGKCVDIFAPGLNILSTWNSGNTSINTISGTSMASPHVAGLAAYFLSLYPDGFNIQEDDFSSESYEQVSGTAQMVLGRISNWRASIRKSGASAEAAQPLSPAALKKALVKVGSTGLLSDANKAPMPAGSPNILIFNNYTSSTSALEAMHASVQELEA
ncbi:BQ5605_C002g01631 [Microbotryum silenes-dioicae]|uniref:BQ5605_C002g01631 protein n=1 Tax=Microbotryum silenes-dioicae TaxID=796604 RepID=A0A2X0M3D9_9BASI|nr:BQ5605_C002g01631 [Microbotryum silenes-dioicae]